MKTIDVYEIDEEVLVKMQVASVKFDEGNLWYELRDPQTNQHFKYMFSPDMLMPYKKPASRKTQEKRSSK